LAPIDGMGGIGASPCDLDREFAPQIAQLLATPPIQSALVLPSRTPSRLLGLVCLLENSLIEQSRAAAVTSLVVKRWSISGYIVVFYVV
jgi:hypothetical protein